MIPYAGMHMSIFSAMLTRQGRLGYLSTFIFSPIVYVWFCRNHNIEVKIYDYVWAALPKPIRPDRVSLVAAKIDDLDSSSIAGLVDENDPQDGWVGVTVTDQLEYDLQTLGRYWQVFYERCAEAFSIRIFSSPLDLWSSARVEEPGCDQVSTGSLTQEDIGGNQRALQPNESPTRAIHLESFTRPSLHDPPNHFSPPSSPSTSPRRSSNRGPPLPSNDSSPPPSLLASPRSHNGNGEMRVNLTIPAPSGVRRHMMIAEGGSRARSATVWLDAADWYEDVTWPDRILRPDSDVRPPPQLMFDEDQIFDPAEAFTEAPTEARPESGPHHRVTALSAHPAESMAQRLSLILFDMFCLPFEAMFVRSVAMAFLSSSSHLAISEGAAARWKGEIHPQWTWHGLGWRSGGFKSIGNYVGKLVLVQGLQAAVSFVTWQIGMGAVWWIGRTKCGWRKPGSPYSMHLPQ